MDYYVYILISERTKNWSYVGQTNDLKKRYNEHSMGKVQATKGHRPLKIAYFETFISREEALKREKYLKSGIGREEKKLLLLK